MKFLSIYFLFGIFGKFLRNYMLLVFNYFDKNIIFLEEEGKKMVCFSFGESLV